MAAQQQRQVNAKQSVQIRVLQSQINSIFKSFTRILNYVNKGGKDQKLLISYNDNAVSSLDLFGANCEMNSNQKQSNVLMAGWAYFDSKRQSMKKSDQKLISEWLDYMDCALGEKQLPELQMTEDTIQVGRENMLHRMPNILSKLIGSQHKTRRMVNNATENAERHQQQDAVMIQNAQQRYQQMQKNVKVPNQNTMYRFSGGAQNKKFGSAICSKTFQNRRNFDEKDADDISMKDNNNAPKQSKQQLYPNAMIIQNMPNNTLMGPNNQPVPIPHPCVIVEDKNNNKFAVRLAAPYNIGKIVTSSCLHRDPVTVSEYEQKYIARNKCKLGYQSIEERKGIQWQ